MPPTAHLISGKYRVVGPLGKGGMGKVYEAVNDAIGRRVALKVIDPALNGHPEFMKRFELEARAAALISHPGIVDVLDMGRTEEGSPFIVMEYLQGITLKQLLRHVGRFTPGEAAAVMAPVLEALSAAHAAGVVHRDLKPANLFVSVKPSLAVKVLDFGISKFGSLGQRVTAAGTTLGTPTFMAPEQMRDGHSVGPAADLYSVGALLYTLVAGKPPFEADTDVQLEYRVLTAAHAPLSQVRPEVPAALSSLVDRLLEKVPERRPSNAQVALELLREAAQPTPEPVFENARRLALGESAGPVARALPPAGKTVLDASAHDSSRRHRTRALPNSRLKIALGLCALALGSGVAAWFASDSGVGAAAPPAPASPEVIRRVRAEPPTAQIRIDGAGAPCNPCELRRPRGSVVALEVSAEGFARVTVPLTFDADGETALALVPAPAPAAPAQPGAEPPGKEAPARPRAPPAKKKELGLDKSNPYL